MPNLDQAGLGKGRVFISVSETVEYEILDDDETQERLKVRRAGRKRAEWIPKSSIVGRIVDIRKVGESGE